MYKNFFLGICGRQIPEESETAKVSNDSPIAKKMIAKIDIYNIYLFFTLKKYIPAKLNNPFTSNIVNPNPNPKNSLPAVSNK